MSDRPQIDKSNAPATALIALGGNLPWKDIAPDALLPKVLDALECDEIRVTARSGLWRTPAWPDPSEPSYVNAVARVETTLMAEDLLARLNALEKVFGRERAERNRSRTLDLDIIDYDGVVQSTGLLTLPHPRATRRAFVLLPLKDVAPEWRDPDSGAGLAELIATLPAEDIEACERIR